MRGVLSVLLLILFTVSVAVALIIPKFVWASMEFWQIFLYLMPIVLIPCLALVARWLYYDQEKLEELRKRLESIEDKDQDG